LVALRPHRLTTLLGKQVGVGVIPTLDDNVILTNKYHLYKC